MDWRQPCSLWYIWWNFTKRASLRHCCTYNVFQPRCWSISVTLDVLWHLFNTHLAALPWTISMECTWILWYRSHILTRHTLCTWGQTNPKYAFSLMSGERIWRFLLRKPRDLLALDITCDTWVFYVMSLDNVKPRYLALLTASSWWSWRIYLWISGFGDLVKFITWLLPGWNSIRSLCRCNRSFSTLMWL